ncbi:ATP-dependent DNA helicase pif1 [Phtheirospermum japonicum]|uniref:ATP-dependent DNA helicase pif1 n=1 Tax=Phtheirospermum japonicum TaxID=374723 RepID=A0A830D3H5_9LAMI|nr:ATP-dependent DNA helicase pif1 [Phtheirospermum japonicum]
MNPHLDDHSKNELNCFAEWTLKIGDGEIRSIIKEYSNNGAWITLPDELLINNTGDHFKIIFEVVYIDFQHNFAEPFYLRQRVILTPHNNTVDQLNTYILETIPAPMRTYHSSDVISKSSTGFSSQNMYPPEVLNVIPFPGIPDHILNLKMGAVVMLLWPFVLNRKQFPLRLSYTMTINKSQGQTLNFIGIYLPKPIFTHGQLYVALLKVTSRHGLKILIHDEDVKLTNITKNVVYREISDNIKR